MDQPEQDLIEKTSDEPIDEPNKDIIAKRKAVLVESDDNKSAEKATTEKEWIVYNPVNREPEGKPDGFTAYYKANECYSPQYNDCMFCGHFSQSDTDIYIVKGYVQRVILAISLMLDGRNRDFRITHLFDEVAAKPILPYYRNWAKMTICIDLIVKAGERLKKVFVEPYSIGSRIMTALTWNMKTRRKRVQPQSMDVAIKFFIDNFAGNKDALLQRAINTRLNIINEKNDLDFYREIKYVHDSVRQCILCGKVGHINDFICMRRPERTVAIFVYMSPFVCNLVTTDQFLALRHVHYLCTCSEHFIEMARSLKYFIENNLHEGTVMRPFEQMMKIVRPYTLMRVVRELYEFIATVIPPEPKPSQTCYYCKTQEPSVYYDDLFCLSAHNQCQQKNAQYIIDKAKIEMNSLYNDLSEEQSRVAYDHLAHLLPIVKQRKDQGKPMNLNEMKVLLYSLLVRFKKVIVLEYWAQQPLVAKKLDVEPDFKIDFELQPDPHPYVPPQRPPAIPRTIIQTEEPLGGFCPAEARYDRVKYKQWCDFEEKLRALETHKLSGLKIIMVRRIYEYPDGPSTSTSEPESRTLHVELIGDTDNVICTDEGSFNLILTPLQSRERIINALAKAKSKKIYVTYDVLEESDLQSTESGETSKNGGDLVSSADPKKDTNNKPSTSVDITVKFGDVSKNMDGFDLEGDLKMDKLKKTTTALDTSSASEETTKKTKATESKAEEAVILEEGYSSGGDSIWESYKKPSTSVAPKKLSKSGKHHVQESTINMLCEELNKNVRKPELSIPSPNFGAKKRRSDDVQSGPGGKKLEISADNHKYPCSPKTGSSGLLETVSKIINPRKIESGSGAPRHATESKLAVPSKPIDLQQQLSSAPQVQQKPEHQSNKPSREQEQKRTPKQQETGGVLQKEVAQKLNHQPPKVQQSRMTSADQIATQVKSVIPKQQMPKIQNPDVMKQQKQHAEKALQQQKQQQKGNPTSTSQIRNQAASHKNPFPKRTEAGTSAVKLESLSVEDKPTISTQKSPAVPLRAPPVTGTAPTGASPIMTIRNQTRSATVQPGAGRESFGADARQPGSSNLRILTGLSQSTSSLHQPNPTSRNSIPSMTQSNQNLRKSIPSLMDIEPGSILSIPSLMGRELAPFLPPPGTSQKHPGSGSLLGPIPTSSTGTRRNLVPCIPTLNFGQGTLPPDSGAPQYGAGLMGPIPGSVPFGVPGLIPSSAIQHGGNMTRPGSATTHPGTGKGRSGPSSSGHRIMQPWEIKSEPQDTVITDFRNVNQRNVSQPSSQRQLHQPNPSAEDNKRRHSSALSGLECHMVLPPPPIPPQLPPVKSTTTTRTVGNKAFQMKEIKSELLDDGYNASRHGNQPSTSSEPKQSTRQPSVGEMLTKQIREQVKKIPQNQQPSASSNASQTNRPRNTPVTTPTVTRTVKALPKEMIGQFAPPTARPTKIKTPAEIKQEVND